MADRNILAFTAAAHARGVRTPAETPRRKHAAAAALAATSLIVGALIFGAHDLAHGVLTAPRGAGWAETIVIDPVSRRFEISGWAASSHPGAALAAVTIFAGDEEIYDGVVKAFERPDVASATKRPEWLRSGWRAAAWLPDSLQPGPHPLRVMAQFDNGDALPLANAPAAKEILSPESQGR